MLNHIVVMGRLTRDPELRRTASGTAVTSFSVAVERDFPNKESGQKETDFIDCVAWRSTGEFVAKYFQKGSMAIVDGRLQIRGWTDNNGNKRRTSEIVVNSVYFGSAKKDTGSDEQAQNAGNTYTGADSMEEYPELFMDDPACPF